MSNLHDQAMQSIYQQVLERIHNHLSRGQQASLQLLIQRLTIAAGGLQQISEFQLVVVQGGDRRSALLLANLRAAQLSLAVRDGKTFRLRVMVCGLPAPDSRTLSGHERLFNTLFMQDDPRVDLLMMEDDKVVPFSCRPPEAMMPWTGSREALLMFGHITEACAKALLGSRLHLQLAGTLRLAIDSTDGACALVTALPDRSRRRLMAWGRRVLRLAEHPGLGEIHRCAAALAEGLEWLQLWARAPLGGSVSVSRGMARDQPVQVLAVGDLLCSPAEAHRLDAMLDLPQTGAGHDVSLTSWTTPHLIANLGRLQAHSRVHPALGQEARPASRDAQANGWLRAQRQGRASFLQTLGVDEAQLVCLLSAPFRGQGRNLAQFLQACHPQMRVALPYLHQALQGKPCPAAVMRWLTEVSGLSLMQLQAIYAGRLDPPVLRVLANLARRDAALQWLSCPVAAPATVRQAAF